MWYWNDARLVGLAEWSRGPREFRPPPGDRVMVVRGCREIVPRPDAIFENLIADGDLLTDTLGVASVILSDFLKLI